MVITADQQRAASLRPLVRRPGRLIAACAVVLVIGVVGAATLDRGLRAAGLSGMDSGTDSATRLNWFALAVVVALSAGHYLAAAVAARAVAGNGVRFGETLLAQLAAATANRITPAGLGGAAVLGRFLNRRAGLSAVRAAGTISILVTLGAVADLLVLLALTTFGSVIGLGGGAAELAQLVGRLVDGLHLLATWWPVGAVVACAIGLLIVRRNRHRRGPGRGRGRGPGRAAGPGRLTAFVAPARAMVRRPRALTIALLSSGSTTLILGLAFAATTWFLPGGHGTASVGALVVGYMVASAATGVLPVPAGFGTAEAAMTAVLVADHVPAAHAVAVVLAFRLLTYWAPAVMGLAAGRRLRQIGAL